MFTEKFHPTFAPNSIENTQNYDFFKQFLNCDFKFKSFDHLRQYECIIILGTGGSSLGGQTLDCIAQGGNFPELIFLDNIDPVTFEQIMKFDPETTGVLAISKSGETTETLTQLITLLPLWEESQIHKHFCVITQDSTSSLLSIAKHHNMPTISHPQEIGGRYSIFTCVGMIVAHFLGMSATKIHKGASMYLNDPLAITSSKFMHHHIQNGKTQVVIMPYSDRLNTFGSWFCQLWAESLGKQGKGTTPIKAQGTTDQHSQLQLYLDGPNDKIFTFISLPKSDFPYPLKHPYLPEFLNGKTMSDLFYAQEQATIQTLKNKGYPVRIIEIQDLSEENIGALFMHFIMETILVAQAMNVNPFDQPAVEEGKILAKTYL